MSNRQELLALIAYAREADIRNDPLVVDLADELEKLVSVAFVSEEHEHEFEDRCYCGVLAHEYFATVLENRSE